MSHLNENKLALHAESMEKYVKKNGGILRCVEFQKFLREHQDLHQTILSSKISFKSFVYEYGEKRGLFWLYYRTDNENSVVNGVYLLRVFVQKFKNKIEISKINNFYKAYPFMQSIITSKKGPRSFVLEYGHLENLSLDEDSNNQANFIIYATEAKEKDKYVRKSYDISIFDKNDSQNGLGERPPSNNSNFKNKLKSYDIPIQLKNTIRRINSTNHEGFDRYKLQSICQTYIKNQFGDYPAGDQKITYMNDLPNHNFLHLLNELLNIEEVQMWADLSTYNIDNALIQKAPNQASGMYKINVPGLAEQRPSVLRGDTIILIINGKNYKVFAWFINLDHIVFAMPDNLRGPSYIGHAKFTLNRTPIKLMHRAIGEFYSNKITKKLFAIDLVFKFEKIEKIEPISLKTNTMQNLAVSACISSIKSPQVSPIIIFGPPGTGKTSTTIECIMQLLKNGKKKVKILAVAPSNHAADLICMNLIEARKYLGFKITITRIMAFLRDPKLVPPEIIRECNIKINKRNFDLPSIDELYEADIVVSTLSCSGYLVSMGMKKGSFTHVFIDEAGEALIPESLIPLSLCNENSTIILAGDPKQLGPVIRSNTAKNYGLDVSLIEKLYYGRIKTNSETELTPEKLTKYGIFELVNNYRAHPAIMSLYNDIFYGGHLKSSADPSITNAMLNWRGLLDKNIPILFKHISGEEERDIDSPSWYNKAELEAVFETVKDLLGTMHINEEDIGIITPYRKQMEKFKQLFHGRRERDDQYKAIRVGTTELFQGIEKKVIIISTVRSKSEYLPFDLKFNLGFANNPKRINVAISRAQSLFIIYGNANILSQDLNFYNILKRIQQLGAYQGPNLIAPGTRSPVKGDYSEVAYEAGPEEVPWRNEEV